MALLDVSKSFIDASQNRFKAGDVIDSENYSDLKIKHYLRMGLVSSRTAGSPVGKKAAKPAANKAAKPALNKSVDAK